MFNNHYKFYKNCFVKYHNNVFNRVSIWTQKTMDTVSFDIIHFCRPIYEDFISIEDENENSDFSLARIVFSKNVYDNIKWEFEYRNIKDMVLRIKTAFNLYKDFFPYFNCEDIEDYNTKSQEYYKKINDKPELDSYEYITELYCGEVSANLLEKKEQEKIDKLLIKARFESYYIIQRLDEISHCLSYTDLKDELDLIFESVVDFNDIIEYIHALYYNDIDFLQRKKNREDAEKNRIIEKNKKLLYKAGILL